MAFIKFRKLEGTTNSSGAVTITADEAIYGMAYGFKWVDGGLTDGVDATLSITDTPEGVDTTLLTLTNANDDAFYILREQAKSNTGALVSGVYQMPIIAGKPKLAVTSGGASKAVKGVLYYVD